MTEHIFRRYLTATEERQLWRALSQYGSWLARRDRAIFKVLRLTGIRVGTLCKMTVGDALRVPSDGVLVLRGEICKRGRGYKAPASKAARAALRELLKLRRERGLAQIPGEPLLCSSRGRRAGMTVRQVEKRMAFWREQAGLDASATPHWWRHTLAKRVLERSEARDPLRIVSALLGHSRVDTSLIYTQPDREDLADAVELASH